MNEGKYISPFERKSRAAKLADAAEGRLDHELQTLQSQLPHATAPPVDLFPPLDSVTRPTVPTNAAAYYLNRKPQTLRAWACLENGPLRPIRINGRLAWGVADIKRLHRGG